MFLGSLLASILLVSAGWALITWWWFFLAVGAGVAAAGLSVFGALFIIGSSCDLLTTAGLMPHRTPVNDDADWWGHWWYIGFGMLVQVLPIGVLVDEWIEPMTPGLTTPVLALTAFIGTWIVVFPRLRFLWKPEPQPSNSDSVAVA